MNKRCGRVRLSRNGFTLIELLVVVLIIGILAAIAVPQYFKIVEKARFAEGANCFAAVKGSMERYNLKNGSYSNATYALMDVSCPNPMKFFNAPTIGTAASAYTLNIVRNGTGNASYGAYTTNLLMPAGTFSCTSVGGFGDCADLLP